MINGLTPVLDPCTVKASPNCMGFGFKSANRAASGHDKSSDRSRRLPNVFEMRGYVAQVWPR